MGQGGARPQRHCVQRFHDVDGRKSIQLVLVPLSKKAYFTGSLSSNFINVRGTAFSCEVQFTHQESSLPVKAAVWRHFPLMMS